MSSPETRVIAPDTPNPRVEANRAETAVARPMQCAWLMKTKAIGIVVTAFAMTLTACGAGYAANGTNASYAPADDAAPSAIDTSWVDQQRANDAAQAAAVQAQIDLQHQWDDFHAQQQQMMDQQNQQMIQQLQQQ